MNNKLNRLKLILPIYLTIATAFISCSRYSTFGERKIHSLSTDPIKSKNKKDEIRQVNNNLFEAGSYTGKKDHITLKYRLLKPKQEKKNNAKYPLVIVFHGSDGIGDDNSNHLGILAKLWATPQISKEYPAYVLAPQFPSRSSNYELDQHRNVLVSVPQNCLKTSLDLIDSLKRTLNIDQKRIYVVGFSMGASSVINVLSMQPDWFAAGISISGIPQFDQKNALANIPIWIMHGNKDTENPFDSDLQFFKEVADHHKIRFWEFENKAHNDIFSPIILGKRIPQWLFKHKKP